MRMNSVLPAVLILTWFIRRSARQACLLVFYLENFNPGSQHHNTGIPANQLMIIKPTVFFEVFVAVVVVVA